MEKRIKPLSKDLVAKIAAGEVITGPVNVVKELIENSLDAKSTLIHISIKDKGTYIKIRDNGIGFNRDDLEIACVRHTTSKLTSMDDFETLENYGFRGEALSSISQVADVTIISKRKNDLMGAEGTVIIIQNLFHNLKDRLEDLKSKSKFMKEYNKIVEVIQYYSIHCNNCSFQLDKDDKVDVISNINNSKKELIKQIFGIKVSTNLLDLNYENTKLDFSLEGLISNTNSTLTRYYFILFINNRLVDCSSLKIAIKELFDEQLMKGNNPFIYLNLKLLQKNLDVNLHPSKREVRYLNEDLINKEISECIKKCLIKKAENQDILKLNTSFSQMINKSSDNLSSLNSSFIDQSKLTPNNSINFNKSQNSLNLDSKSTFKKSIAAYKVIRNDSTSRKISDMFAIKKMTERDEYQKVDLKSVIDLRKEIDNDKDFKLTQLIRHITLIGILDHRRILIQHEEFMYILDFIEFSKQFFYQSYLNNFGNFKSITFENDLHLIDLLQIYKDNEPKIQEFDLEENIINLIDKKDMFDEYFSMKITEDGFLKSIPIIIDGHKPNLNLLPILVWNLTCCNYNNEKKCFKTIGEAFADYYSRPLENLDEQKQNINNIFSRFKEQLKPNADLNERLIPIADLQNLYKIFERC